MDSYNYELMKILIAIAVLTGILFINSIVHINNVLAQTSYKKYGYEAIVPIGSYSYLTAVKGTIYPHLASNANHVDRMVYMYTTVSSTLTIGVGHYESYENGQPKIYYMMYVDRGDSPDKNKHYVVKPASLSSPYTATLERTSSNYNSATFAAKINDETIKTWTCTYPTSGTNPCNNLRIFGAASWGTKDNSNSFNVYAYIYNLQVKRNGDTSYKNYNDVTGTLIKCYEEPWGLGFKSPRYNPYNQMIVDATTDHQCNYASEVWLYHNGSGG